MFFAKGITLDLVLHFEFFGIHQFLKHLKVLLCLCLPIGDLLKHFRLGYGLDLEVFSPQQILVQPQPLRHNVFKTVEVLEVFLNVSEFSLFPFSLHFLLSLLLHKIALSYSHQVLLFRPFLSRNHLCLVLDFFLLLFQFLQGPLLFLLSLVLL